jgi:transcriptional regulator with GAF, ATPase, and Fis domain
MADDQSDEIAELRRQVALQGEQLDRLRTLSRVDHLVRTLADVLDVRDVFDRVAQIANEVLPHDGMLIGQLVDGGQNVLMYVTHGLNAESVSKVSNISRRLVTDESWEYLLIEDVRERPDLADSTVTRFGMLSAVFVPVRLGREFWGGLSVYGKRAGQFTINDVLVVKRIADYLMLGLSHQRMAEEARANDALRAKAAKHDLLDDLLSMVTDSGELPEVFDRISRATQTVLAHDALVLTAVLPGNTDARVYAQIAPKGHELPEIVKVPPLMRRDPSWDHDVVPDLLAHADQRGLDIVKAGYRSALRVAIRLDGEYAAGLTFASLTPHAYSEADVAAARRIADRITLGFARERTKALARQVDEAAGRAERLESRVRALTDELNARSGYHRLIGESPSWRRVLSQAAQVGATESTVLLLGESGTGKEVVARFIHRASARARGPFAAVNCAALPEQLLEAELFGYERGAFTSAVQSKPGQFEQAAGGTLLLDEVGEMSLSVQPKFLRVLQERVFQRLGGTRAIKADIRIVAATNRDLESAIERRQFREDLFYRLNVFPIRLPPLRERRDDILALSEAFLLDLGQALGRPPGGLSQDAKRALLDYHWPGNVRELRNLLERAAILSEGGLIVREHFVFRPGSGSGAEARPAPEARREDLGDLKNVERDMIQQALNTAKFNKSQAAKALGITRAQLYVKLRQYQLG